MVNPFRANLSVILLAGASTVLAGGAAAQGQRDGRSRAEKTGCGSELVTVLANGARREFVPVEGFFAGYTVVMIDQGEKPRPAVRLSDVLSQNGATWVEALDCANVALHLPAGLSVEGVEFLVLTGRGTLKAVRESSPGRFQNLAQNIRKLTFHGGGNRPRVAPTTAPAE